MFDTASLKITKRVDFPRDSRPYMLRVSPDGREVWVQTPGGGNTVLDAQTLETKDTKQVGRGAVTNNWSPDGRYGFVTGTESWVTVMDAKDYRVVKNIEVGQGGSNVSFRADGRFAYVSVTNANAVAVIDVQALEVVEQLRAGDRPMGLVLYPS